jgi:hypothetical protein
LPTVSAHLDPDNCRRPNPVANIAVSTPSARRGL